MLIINNWGTKLHTCGGLQSYNKMKGRSNKNYYNNNSEKETVKEEKRTELNQEEVEILIKEIYKGTRNIINNIVKNLNK